MSVFQVLDSGLSFNRYEMHPPSTGARQHAHAEGVVEEARTLPLRHPRARGDPEGVAFLLDPRLREDDKRGGSWMMFNSMLVCNLSCARGFIRFAHQSRKRSCLDKLGTA